MQHEPGAGQHDKQLGGPHVEVVQRRAGGHEAVGIELGPAIPGVVDGKAGILMRLLPERLHDANAADCLFDLCIERAHPAKQRLPVAGHAGAIAGGDRRRDRHDDGCQQCQMRLDRGHERKGAKKGHDRDKQVLRPVMRDFADLLHVLCQAGDEVPGALIVEERERQALDVCKRAAAQLGLDVDAELVPPIGDDGHERGVEQVNR